jgi:O-antigen ligase
MAVGVVVRRPGPDARWLALAVLLLAPALGAAAVVSPANAVLGVAGLVFVAVAFHDLAAGVALFAVIIFLAQVPGISGEAPVKFAGLVLVLAALRRSGTPLLLKEHPALAYAAAFLAVWALASSLWAEDTSRAAGEGFRLALNVALVFIVFAAVRHARHARLLVWGYIGGAAVAAVVAVVGPGYDATGRVGGTLGNPNLLAAMLVPALVFSLFALAWTPQAAQRWLLGACSLLFTGALFLTGSRGGLVALAAAFSAAVLFGGSVRRRFLAYAAVAASMGFVYYAAFASAEAMERLMNPGRGSGRADVWSVATGVIADHPIVGVGTGNLPVVAPQYASETINLPDVRFVVDTPKDAHNTYLGVLAELGVVGLVAFGLVVVSALVLARRSTKAFARAGDPELELLSRALFVALVGMLGHFVFLSGQYEKQFWLLIGLAVALQALSRRRERGRVLVNDRTWPITPL